MMEVVIPTKDRPVRLFNILAQVRAAIPNAEIIVTDNSPEPAELPFPVEHHIHAPLPGFGNIRQAGLDQCKGPLAVTLDDDVFLTPGWYPKIRKAMEESQATVVSSRIIYGAPVETTIGKIYKASRTRNVGAGAIIFDVEKLRKAGGWNRKINVGEDTDLALRLGKEWIVSDAEVWHPLSFDQWMRMAAKYGSQGVAQNIKRGDLPKSYALRTLGAPFTMPFYYGWKTRSAMVALYYFLYRSVYALGFIKGVFT